MTALYRLEDELATLEAQIAREQTALAGTPFEDYEFQGWDGPVRLSELFGDHDRLILIHNMGSSCAYCSMWADGINAQLKQLEKVAAIVLVNHDATDVQRRISEQRGWSFRMLDASATDFTDKMGFFAHEGEDAGMLPGTSTFTQDADGTIRCHARSFFGPNDRFNLVYSYLALLPEEASAEFSPT